MSRSILLVEPGYKNKYPPIGLMKISTYHKKLGDKVRFYKGDFKTFIIEEIYTELLQKLSKIDDSVFWEDHRKKLLSYIKVGKNFQELSALSEDPLVVRNLKYYRDYYRFERYLENPSWDRIYITTLFTFHWDLTIKTINDFKGICKDPNQVIVGGIAASILPKEMEKATGIYPIIGQLTRKGELDDNEYIIDEQPLDYSLLYETDYEYPENDGYYGYMTRGCVNHCKFCVVPTLEPNYCGYISIKNQIEETNKYFGEKRHLLLLDNNVLASDSFDRIIDEIKECGFYTGAYYVPQNQYELGISGLKSGWNDRGYIRFIYKQYRYLLSKCTDVEREEIYVLLREHHLLSPETSRKDEILKIHPIISPLYQKRCQRLRRKRTVDFNQGIDARQLTAEKVKRLTEIPVEPVRFAFDRWSYHKTYEKAVRLAAENGIKKLSNYLLYNYTDKPIELYNRLRLNIDLSEELKVSIYSFPMRYQPVKDPEYFSNRLYVGKHWNKKFVRAVLAVLNATKGKIGVGLSFFERAFGKDESEFEEILYMPETLIIYREYYQHKGITDQWRNAFYSLDSEKLEVAKKLIENNEFTDITTLTDDAEILHLLSYYTITRNTAKKDITSSK